MHRNTIADTDRGRVLRYSHVGWSLTNRKHFKWLTRGVVGGGQ